MVTIETGLLFFLFGLLTSFSPCLFPLLPSYVAITVHNKHSRKKIFISSIFLILGILTVFLIIGLISNQIGGFLIRNYGTFSLIQGILLIISGVFVIKPPSIFYKINIPSNLENILYGQENDRNILYFNYIVGLAYTFIAAPCAGGIFLSVWTQIFASTIQDGIVIIVLFSFGAGLPFLIMSLYIPVITSDLIEKINNATKYIFPILGLLLIISGFWLINSTSETLISLD